ncbi:MAG TPA: hypothetical protein VD886_24525, partial [Herpetosiphonaceae bacterium]|nr:hypothetical protein [Herpetosiphonaceae bacterium]
MAEFDQALDSYDAALAALPERERLERAAIAILEIDVLVRATRFEEAADLIDAVEADLRGLAPEGRPLPPDARVLLARLAELRSLKSQRLADVRQALDWAEHGLAQIARLPAAHPQVAATRTRLYQATAAAAMALNDFSRSRRMLGNAFRLVKRYPHPSIEGELQLRQALLVQRTEQLRPAIRLFRAVLPRLEATGTRDRLSYVLLPGGQALAYHGDYAESEAWLARGVRLGKETGSAFLVCSGLSVLCWLNTHTGDWDAVLRYSEEGKLLAERHELRLWFTRFLACEGEIRFYRGEFAHGNALFNQLQGYGEEHALVAQRYLAYGAFMAGELGQALGSMIGTTVESASVASSDQAFDVLGIAEWRVLLMSQGVLPPQDDAILEQAVINGLAFWQQHGYRSNLPYGWRIRAMLAWQAGRLGVAQAAIRRGLAVARRIGNVPEQARCLFWRAKIDLRAGAPQRSRRDLADAARIFAALGAWPEHGKTEALMRAPHDHRIVL